MKKLILNSPVSSLLLCTALIVTSASCANESNNEATDNSSPATQSADKVKAATADELMIETISHGEEAHNNHCYKCHTDEVYSREDRFVKSIDALSKQVIRCKDGSNVPWFDEDTDAVVQFLNQKYYKF